MNQPLRLSMLSAAVLGLLSTNASAAFIEDSKASLTLRNFYINQDVRNQDDPSVSEWGQGFFLNFQSGYTEGPVGFGVDALGLFAVRLDSGGDADKADISRKPGSVFPLETNGDAVHDFGHLGLTGKIRFSKTEARLGSLQPKLPVVTFNDGRLLPQTYEGGQITSNEWEPLTLLAGKLEHSYERNSSNDEGLSIAGANSGKDARLSNAFYYGGADYRITKDLLAQYYYGNLEDFYRQHFLGLVHNWKLPVGSLKTDLRYFYSTSDGENSSADGRADGYVSSGYYGLSATGKPVTKGEVDNKLWSAMLTYGLKGHSLSAGYQQVTGESDFPHLNQGQGRTLYLITNAQMGKFTSSGEKTWVAGYSYDFANVGVPGLKAGLTYFKGTDIDNYRQENKEWERDFRVDYTVPEGMFKGVGVTWRNAMWRGNDTKDQDENRLIVSYTIPLI